jgi:hypothetical protein
MNLYEYLLERRRTDAKFRDCHFAKQVGMGRNTLSLIKYKRFRPSGDLAMLIVNATDGLVTLEEVIDFTPTKKKIKSTKRKQHSLGKKYKNQEVKT